MASSADDLPRSTSGSAYAHLFELSEGGMGTVSVVVRTEGSFRRLHALKRLGSAIRSDETFRKMFLDEGRVAGLIRHPNVVSVLDVGEDEDGPYLILDYVLGVPLTGLLRLPRRVPLQIALRVAQEVAQGLHAAHELADHTGRPLHLVHRDVSPQNILVSYDGSVQVTDFGIAKALGASTRTSTGVLKGKLGYMPPEQLKFLEIDRRADIFSLGIVFFELLSGSRLYSGGGEEAPRRILYEPPPDILDVREDVPAEVVELLLELLAKEPEDRPQTAEAVARRIETVLAGEVARDGVYSLAEFMDQNFEEHRRAAEAGLARALAELDERSSQPSVDAGLARANPASEEPEGVTVAATPRAVAAPRRRWSALVAIGAAGLVALALGWGFYPRGDVDVAEEARGLAEPEPEVEPEVEAAAAGDPDSLADSVVDTAPRSGAPEPEPVADADPDDVEATEGPNDHASDANRPRAHSRRARARRARGRRAEPAAEAPRAPATVPIATSLDGRLDGP